jgi:hypothetical protein
MKFVAIGCMLLVAVGHLRTGDDIGLGSTLMTCAVSFGYIRAIRAGAIEGIALPGFFRRITKSRGKAARESDPPGEMDALLDKIAKTGMDSLTAKERSRLQSARAEIMKRDRR